MNRIVLILLLLVPASVLASSQTVPSKSTVRIPVEVGTGMAAMIIFERRPKAVTGNTQPYFGVEYLGDRMMVAARQAGAVANVFVDFGDDTIAILEFRGVSGRGADLLRLKPQEAPKPPEPSWSHKDFPADLAFLAAPWKVHKLGDGDKSGGLKAKVHYAIAVDDYLLLHLEIENERAAVFSLSNITVSRIDLGGFKGTTIIAAAKIPTAIHMAAATLSPGEKTSGTVILPNVPLAHDQALLINFEDAVADGPQVRIAL